MEANDVDPMVFSNELDSGSEDLDYPVYNSFEDPFAHIHDTTGSLNDDAGLECEMKAYEARYNAKGEVHKLQVGKRRQFMQEKSSDHGAAIVLTRHFDKLDELEFTEIRIQSPHIKEALRQVVRSYPGLNFNAPVILMRGLPKCLFHYRKELAEYGRTVQDLTAVQHLEFILLYTYQQLSGETLNYSLYMESPSIAPGLEFSDLWMAFRPGDLIVTRQYKVSQILRFESMSQRGTRSTDDWLIKAAFIDSDGESFGLRTDVIRIENYDNYMPLVNLAVYPLDFHLEKQKLVESLRERGKKFVALQGIHYRYYEGAAHGLWPSNSDSDRYHYGNQGQEFLHSKPLNERIIVDTEGFQSDNPDDEVEFTTTLHSCADKGHQLEEKDLLICNFEVPAFSLSSRRWWKVKVEGVKEIDFNTDAFDKLILPGGQKDMIHSLVNVHANNLLKFDDVIAGKGKGMVFLLHGESGTGKTLTAESVADYTKRPLYVVGCADLGTNISKVEKNLTRILRISTKWNAILLLDEADVFLERRSTHDLERNGLVSVFLRVLEYFEGILFLTTNRINAFDKAVKSRVHMAIRFPKLSLESRRKLWITFIEKTTEGVGVGWCHDDFLNDLANRELNGRQIKNVVRTALALAVSKNQSLGTSHLLTSLDHLTQFDAQLEPDFANSPEDAPTPLDHIRHGVKRRRV